MHDDDTLEDVEELLREIRERRSSGRSSSSAGEADGGDTASDESASSVVPGGDETIVVEPAGIAEAEPGLAPSLAWSDDDETIDVDPEILRQLRSTSAGGASDDDATVVADVSRLAGSRLSESVSDPSEAGLGEPGRVPGSGVPPWGWMAGGLLVVAILAVVAFRAGWLTSGDDIQAPAPVAPPTTPAAARLAEDGMAEAPLTAPQSESAPQIAFTSNFQLHVMDTDNTSPRIVSDKADVIFPVWSPDKTRIAFYGGGEPGPFELFVIEPDGSNLLQLTTIGIETGALPPAWSPDGTRIAFFGVRKLSDSSFRSDVLHIVDADGSRLHRISDRVGYAEWSPDGSKIAFDEVEVLDDGSFEGYVYLMEANGSSIRRLTTGSSDYLVGWLPNGLALGRDLPNRNSRKITLVDEDGSMIRHLMDLSNDEFIYSVSPNGDKFLLARIAEDGGELSVIDVNGANRIRLTDDYKVSHVSWPVWSPDGTMIAYISDQDGDDEVYVVRADGSDLRQLTRNDVQERIGSWE